MSVEVTVRPDNAVLILVDETDSVRENDDELLTSFEPELRDDLLDSTSGIMATCLGISPAEKAVVRGETPGDMTGDFSRLRLVVAKKLEVEALKLVK